MSLIKQKILIIDYGSQYTQLIARRIRELQIYCEVYPFNKINKKVLNDKTLSGIVLSGGPNSVKAKNSPKLDNQILNLNKPILGICYGLQLIAKNFKGKVSSVRQKREFGKTLLKKEKNSILTKNFFKKKNLCLDEPSRCC